MGNTIQGRVDFFEIETENKAITSGIHRILSANLDKALTRFYAKVSTVPALSHFFRDKQHMDAAKSAQAQHWIGMFSEGLDENYHKRALRIGQVHARVGLEPQWYIGGYSLVMEDIIHAMVAPGLLRFLPWRRALARQLSTFVKVSLLDMDVALSAYSSDTQAKIQEVCTQLATALESAAQGCLTVRATGLPAEYAKVEQDFNAAIGTLQKALATIIDGVSVMSDGAREIRAGSDDLARRTEQQAASLEETAAALSQVTANVRETAQTTADARKAIARAHDEATHGDDVVNQAVEAMGRIEESSRQIGQIISVIDGIAFQTNLLALNAGVEAARAGEAGKGFAVVASEVRALAQRSAEAANDIKELITASAQQVSKGVELVSNTGNALSAIAEKISELRGSIDEIAQSAEVQATNLGQINSSVSDMDRMTQQNAAMAEQCTAAARSLAEQADGMSGLVKSFDLGSASGSRLHGSSASLQHAA